MTHMSIVLFNVAVMTFLGREYVYGLSSRDFFSVVQAHRFN